MSSTHTWPPAYALHIRKWLASKGCRNRAGSKGGVSTLDAAPSPPMLRSWVPLRGGTCASTDPRRSGLVPEAAPGKADMPGGFMQVATAARLLSWRRAAAGDGERPGWAGGQLTCMPPRRDAAGVMPQLPPSAAKVGMWQSRRASILLSVMLTLSPLSSEGSPPRPTRTTP